MANLMFLKLGDKIKGESTDDKHKDWIEIHSFNWGVSQPVSQQSGTGGRTGGGCSFSDVQCMKTVDSSSCDLMSFCAAGEHIPKAEIEVVLDTKEKHIYFKIELENVIISSISPSGGGGGGGEKPVEALSLNFGTFKQFYTPVDQTGKPGSEVSRGWDLQKNQPLK